ncbi:hypothetical protein PS2_031933 [Malus domestica]
MHRSWSSGGQEAAHGGDFSKDAGLHCGVGLGLVDDFDGDGGVVDEGLGFVDLSEAASTQQPAQLIFAEEGGGRGCSSSNPETLKDSSSWYMIRPAGFEIQAGISYSRLWTFLYMAIKLLSSKGRRPASRTKRMTPHDHASALEPS